MKTRLTALALILCMLVTLLLAATASPTPTLWKQKSNIPHTAFTMRHQRAA